MSSKDILQYKKSSKITGNFKASSQVPLLFSFVSLFETKKNKFFIKSKLFRSFCLVYNKEGPKLGSGYEAKDITATIFSETKQIRMKTENSHFSVIITLKPENDEDFQSLRKKIKEAIENTTENTTEKAPSKDEKNFEDKKDS
ncbi:Protein of unknown function [Cotesia congregata]|uniref:Uncharacterized protein n=1 Tax=Cotesia congregata TaxID=51543 RepID=A0A8J2ML76_COTCN|nr:Protein of unknown function [Cotesia congregata]